MWAWACGALSAPEILRVLPRPGQPSPVQVCDMRHTIVTFWRVPGPFRTVLAPASHAFAPPMACACHIAISARQRATSAAASPPDPRQMPYMPYLPYLPLSRSTSSSAVAEATMGGIGEQFLRAASCENSLASLCASSILPAPRPRRLPPLHFSANRRVEGAISSKFPGQPITW